MSNTISKKFVMNKKCLFGFLATLGIMLSVVPIAKAEYVDAVGCSPTGQVCDKTANYTFDADGSSSYVLRIKAPANHCSAVKYTLSWEDSTRSRTVTTRFLNREESVTIPIGRKFSAGQQVITIAATGKTGGCNKGVLGSWGAEITATPQ